MTLGNHEFDDGCEATAGFVRAQPYPVLAANLDARPGCPLRGTPVQPWIIKEIRGVKVGIMGIANPSVRTLSAACPDTRFTNSAATLKKAVAALEAQGVRHIIALTHLGLPKDVELARSVDGVDIIVGGHTHSYLGPGSSSGPYPLVEHSPSGKPVLVVTAGALSKYLGQLDVTFDAQGVPLRWKGAAMNGYKLTFYTQQGRVHGPLSIAEWLLKEAKAIGIEGATFAAAQGGYGRDGKYHSARFFDVGEQPVEVTM